MIKRYFYIFTGSLLIAVALVFFFIPYNIISTGVFGIGTLIYYQFGIIPSLSIFIMNIISLFIAYLVIGKEKVKEYIIPVMLIPVLVFGLLCIYEHISLEPIETILAVVAGAFLTGIGFNLLHKEVQSVGGVDALQDTINGKKTYRTKTFTYIIEVIILITASFLLNIEAMIYSLIAIVILRLLSQKSKIGTSTSKTFFIITNKEIEVKDYIMNELNHDLTEFNVKGGYSNSKNKIIMTVMDTKDYYALREGIKTIDKNAFISILDSYEVINKNKALEKKED